MKCPECQAPNKNNVQFCGTCGKIIAAELAAAKIAGGLELMGQSWEIFKNHWKKFVPLTLIPVVAGLAFGIVLVLDALTTSFVEQGYLNQISLIILQVILSLLGIVALLAFIYLVVRSAIAQLLLVEKLALSVREAWQGSQGKFWGYLWITILTVLIIVAGLLFFVVPGVIWSVMFVFGPMVFVYEGLTGWSALKRSRELVRGFWWTVFARLIIIELILVVVAVLINIPTIIIQGVVANEAVVGIISSINSALGNLIIAPWSLIAFYLLYKSLSRAKADRKLKRG